MRTIGLIVVTAVSLGALATLAPARPADGRTSRQSQFIVFMRPGVIGEYDLWVVRPDGSGLRRLTASPRARSDYNPDWSPDGSTVLFERRVLDGVGDELYLVGADGSGLRSITTCVQECWSDSEARWSADGRQIAFGRATGPHDRNSPSLIAIYLMNADGTGLRQLSHPPQGYEDHYPTWSPDGHTIVFQRDTNANPPGRTRLIAIDPLTARERTVSTLPAWAGGGGIAKYSPDGRRLLFSYWCIYGDGCAPSSRSARNARLATIKPDGTALRVLRLHAHGDSGTWSPDGTRIAFRCWAKTGLQLGNFRLCTSKLDGTGLKRFPWKLDSAEPDWGSSP
jgi:Tol biopolymer transport system component